MNFASIQSKLHGGKWSIERSAFDGLYHNVNRVHSLTYVGLKGLIFGNPLISKSQSSETASSQTEEQQTGDIAVINISGILVKGANEEAEQLLGLINIDKISQALDNLAADPSVSAIVLHISSPGGETVGVDVLGRKIRNIDANIKPIYAWTETQAASAAYWLASQTKVIGMTSSASVGSVGVYMLLNDESAKLAQDGVKVNAVYSGKHKLLGHDFKELTDEERSILQTDVSKQHETFKEVIKSNRPEVKEEALEGLSYEGADAFNHGLVDIVCDSLEEFLMELSKI